MKPTAALYGERERESERSKNLYGDFNARTVRREENRLDWSLVAPSRGHYRNLHLLVSLSVR